MKIFILTLFLAVTFALSANDARACSCGDKPSVLDAYEVVDMVVIARVTSVTKAATQPNQESYYPDDIRSVTVVVEKIYKGNTRVRNELTVAQGDGGNCIWNFGERDIGEKYLFYFKRREKADVYVASICSRTNLIEDAKEDLLYLDNLKKRRGKTRVSGKYLMYDGNDVANKTVLVRGDRTYETRTDDRGVFEIYDLPPGEYKLQPEPPRGWRLNYRTEDPPATTSVPFTLAAKKHVAFDLNFVPDTSVEGTVIGPDGNPLNGVCTHLVSRDLSDIFTTKTCTDHDGSFRFEGMPAATYILFVNLAGRISTREPFPTLFYPNAADIKDATSINVRAGERVKGISLVIPKLYETINVTGVVKFSDDSPVANRAVRFKSVETKIYDGDTYVVTNANGYFSLTLIKGLKGEIYADMLARNSEYENCPRVAALIKESGFDETILQTSPVAIDAESSIEYLELRFPFPNCGRR